LCAGAVRTSVPDARIELVFYLEHDLFGKPVSTFPDHAL